MRLDCVINSIIITINIDKVLSALFLPLRLSSPNIYKYRTVPRRRRNRKRVGRWGTRAEERGTGGKRKRKKGGTKARMAKMLETRKGSGEGYTIRTVPPFAKGPRQQCPSRRKLPVLRVDWGLAVEEEAHRGPGPGDQGMKRRKRWHWRGC